MTKGSKEEIKISETFREGMVLLNIWVAISIAFLQQLYVSLGLMEGVQVSKSHKSHDRYEKNKSTQTNQQIISEKTSESLSLINPQTPGTKVHNYPPGAPLKAKRRSLVDRVLNDEENELEYRLTGYRRGEEEGEPQTPSASPIRRGR